MNDDEQRALRACTDVLTVEKTAPGMVRVVTLTDAYMVDAREAGCYCPDKEYHKPPMCKHDYAAVLSDTDLPTPFMTVENVDERTDPAFDLEVPDRIGKDKQLTAFADGGELKCDECAELPEGWPCAECFIYDEESITA